MVYPIIASDKKEVKKLISKGETVIHITDAELISEIGKQKNADTSIKHATTQIAKCSAIGTAIAAVAPHMIVTIICGKAALKTLMMALNVKLIHTAFIAYLRNYDICEDDSGEIYLIKTRGFNKMHNNEFIGNSNLLFSYA